MPDFYNIDSALSEEERAVRDTVRSFVATPVTPDGALGLTPIVRDALAELTLQWCQAEYDRLAADERA